MSFVGSPARLRVTSDPAKGPLLLSAAFLSLAAFAIAILFSCFTPINVGLLAIAFAFLVGVFFAGMKASDVAAGFPSSEAACVTEWETDEGCANQTVENTCDSGETYHPNEASSCLSQLRALDCSQVRSGDIEAQAPACDRVCTVE